MTRRQRQAKHAAEHRHMVRRLVARYEAAGEEIRAQGREWYPTAANECARLPARFETAAAVVAALSPQTRWRENLASARHVLEAVGARRWPHEARGYRANVAKAVAIAQGAPVGRGPGDAFGGEAPKVRAFWAAICGDVDAIVLDVWACRAALDRDGVVPSGSRYGRIASAYRVAANQCGEHARDFQAIIWLTIRPLAEHWKDQQLLLEAT